MRWNSRHHPRIASFTAVILTIMCTGLQAAAKDFLASPQRQSVRSSAGGIDATMARVRTYRALWGHWELNDALTQLFQGTFEARVDGSKVYYSSSRSRHVVIEDPVGHYFRVALLGPPVAEGLRERTYLDRGLSRPDPSNVAHFEGSTHFAYTPPPGEADISTDEFAIQQCLERSPNTRGARSMLGRNDRNLSQQVRLRFFSRLLGVEIREAADVWREIRRLDAARLPTPVLSDFLQLANEGVAHFNSPSGTRELGELLRLVESMPHSSDFSDLLWTIEERGAVPESLEREFARATAVSRMTQALYAAPRGARAPLAYWNAFLDYLQTADHRATSASTPPERRGPRPIAGADEFETDVALYGADHFDTAAERRRKLALILRMPHPDEFERVAEALEHLALLEWARLPAVVRLDLMYVMKTAGAASSHEVNEREIAALLRLAEVSRDIGWLSTVEGIQHLDIDKRLRRRATEVREGLLNGSRVTTIDPSPQQIEYWNHARNDIRAGRAPTARAELLRTDVHLETERASEPRHLRPAPAPSCGHLFGPH